MKIYIVRKHFSAPGIETILEAEAEKKGNIYYTNGYAIDLQTEYEVLISTFIPAHTAHEIRKDAVNEAIKIQEAVVEDLADDLSDAQNVLGWLCMGW